MRTETVTKEIFTFDELNDDAKERAREWWRECENLDSSFDEHIYEDSERVAEILGIDFDCKSITLMNGKTRKEPKIWYSGFWSQGDGACFDGSYAYASGSSKAIREYAPTDKTLHAIADDLQEVQRRNFYKLCATCQHSGHYYHSGCMRVSVEHADDSWRDISDNDIDTVQCALRSFADWIYSALSAEYEHIMSDENVDESIRCNEYEFTEDGEIY